MLFFVPVTVFVLFFVLIRSKMGAASGPSAARGLAGGRVLARGLVLSASPFVSGERTQNGQRYELRDLLLDVEVQGQAPYEVSVTPLIPRICEARPGAALDLSLDPRNPSDVVVIGPAGASAWIGAAPWLMQSPAVGLTGGGKLVLSAVLAGFPAFLALGLVIAVRGHQPPQAAPHAGPHTVSASCDLAARCCKVISGASCGQFGAMGEGACASVLQAERTTAAKAHKRCP